jgi:rubrerythrin
MMKTDFKTTETYKNLMASFAGESQARNRYACYGEVAQRQGYPLIKKAFDYIADQEKVHAKVFYLFLTKELNGQTGHVNADYPIDLNNGETIPNLIASLTAELLENQTLYPAFARTAQAEGYPLIAQKFHDIAKIEGWHANIFTKIMQQLRDGTMFKRNEAVDWHCDVCGNIIHGFAAPERCPVCEHPRGFFYTMNDRY